MNIKYAALKVGARALWILGGAVHKVGSLAHALGRTMLRLAHRMDNTLNKFW